MTVPTSGTPSAFLPSHIWKMCFSVGKWSGAHISVESRCMQQFLMLAFLIPALLLSLLFSLKHVPSPKTKPEHAFWFSSAFIFQIAQHFWPTFWFVTARPPLCSSSHTSKISSSVTCTECFYWPMHQTPHCFLNFVNTSISVIYNWLCVSDCILQNDFKHASITGPFPSSFLVLFQGTTSLARRALSGLVKAWSKVHGIHIHGILALLFNLGSTSQELELVCSIYGPNRRTLRPSVQFKIRIPESNPFCSIHGPDPQNIGRFLQSEIPNPGIWVCACNLCSRSQEYELFYSFLGSDPRSQSPCFLPGVLIPELVSFFSVWAYLPMCKVFALMEVGQTKTFLLKHIFGFERLAFIHI